MRYKMKEPINKNNKFIYFICLFIFKIVLELIYKYAVSVEYGYAFFYYKPTFEKWIIAFAMFLIVYLSIPKSFTKLSHFCSALFGIYVILPLTSYYWMSGQKDTFIFMIVFCFFLLNFILRGKIKIKIKYIRFNYSVLNILAIIMFALWLLFIAEYGMPGFEALNISDIYELRAFRSYSVIWGYLMSFMTTSIIPAVLLISIKEKKYGLTISSILCQLYFYMYGGNKAVFLAIGVVLGVYYVVNKKKNYLVYLSCTFSTFIVFSFFTYKWLKNLVMLSLIPIRTFFIPSQISFWYYEFFGQHEKLYLRESIFGRLFGLESPYGIETGKLIGNAFGQFGNNCNNGYLGYAYADGGFMFMILATVILGIIFLIIDNMLMEDNRAVGIALLSFTTIVLADGGLLTTLLTGGFILNIIILYLYSSSFISRTSNKINKGDKKNE